MTEPTSTDRAGAERLRVPLAAALGVATGVGLGGFVPTYIRSAAADGTFSGTDLLGLASVALLASAPAGLGARLALAARTDRAWATRLAAVTAAALAAMAASSAYVSRTGPSAAAAAAAEAGPPSAPGRI